MMQYVNRLWKTLTGKPNGDGCHVYGDKEIWQWVVSCIRSYPQCIVNRVGLILLRYRGVIFTVSHFEYNTREGLTGYMVPVGCTVGVRKGLAGSDLALMLEYADEVKVVLYHWDSSYSTESELLSHPMALAKEMTLLRAVPEAYPNKLYKAKDIAVTLQGVETILEGYQYTEQGLVYTYTCTLEGVRYRIGVKPVGQVCSTVCYQYQEDGVETPMSSKMLANIRIKLKTLKDDAESTPYYHVLKASYPQRYA